MRLWHKNLIPFLPRTQICALWRELNSIYKKQDNHILINYIYDYPKSTLKNYSDFVIAEMQKRGYKINKWDNYNKYFNGVENDDSMFKEHDNTYLEICYWNLYEKFIRGQKDFELEQFCDMSKYVKKKISKIRIDSFGFINSRMEELLFQGVLSHCKTDIINQLS